MPASAPRTNHGSFNFRIQIVAVQAPRFENVGTQWRDDRESGCWLRETNDTDKHTSEFDSKLVQETLKAGRVVRNGADAFNSASNQLQHETDDVRSAE